MSVGYTWVQWNRHKRVYDSVAAGCVLAFVAVFFVVTKLIWRGEESFSDEIVLIRATGSAAILLLHVVLCIGPMARLDRRFLPLLYNRRHLGVMTFLVGLVHAVVVLGFYHGFGVVNPLVSLLGGNKNFTSFRAFPFQLLGLGALLIMFLMAATSHDFWLRHLSARAWKWLHMLVYPAYALLIGHVSLGALQSGRSAVGPALIGAGVVVVIGLHLAAGMRETRKDRGTEADREDGAGWIDVGAPDEIPSDRARTVCTAGGERIAVFKHNGVFSGVTNLCVHQGGPIGEGKIIDGCITCPWHGWQYRPQDGCSPPPFQEKLATYEVRVIAGRVRVRSEPDAAAASTGVGHG